MSKRELPEWTTEMDREILEILNTELVLTPTVIAENIDRSRGAISRRLNALEAGGLVKKTDRGKYVITKEAADMFTGGWTLDKTPEYPEAVVEDVERQRQIKENLGITEAQLLREVEKEYDELRSDSSEEFGDLIKKAFENVIKRYEDNGS